MKEKIRVNDLTTLFICPSKEWRTLERKAIADCVYHRDCGGNPVLFCIKNTKVDLEAKRLDLPRIHYTGQSLNRLFDLRYIRDMRRILKERRFDIVHCYSLDFIWGVAFNLLSHPKIPLLLTFNHFLDSAQKSLWQKWLFRRVDLVVTFSQTTKEIAQETLPVSFRKIKIAGGGIEFSPRLLSEERLVKNIGCIVSTNEEFQNAKVIIYAMKSLLPAVNDLGISLKFVVYNTIGEEGVESQAELEKIAKDIGIEEFVEFRECPQYEPVFKETDIFVGTSFDEPFNDFEIMAILSRVPVIFPRTASRQSVLFQYKWVGESYYFEDARELKAKLLKLLINEQVYINELQDSHQEIKDLHGIDAYSQRVLGFYERLYSKRLRFLKHKQKLNYS